jgi:hypothetical protein
VALLKQALEKLRHLLNLATALACAAALDQYKRCSINAAASISSLDAAAWRAGWPKIHPQKRRAGTAGTRVTVSKHHSVAKRACASKTAHAAA